MTVLASTVLVAKYPLSEASVDPARPPNANTSTQARAVAGSLRSSPSLLAMSAIDRSMMTVDTGSSTGSAASPNVPPAAPEAVASARCSSTEDPDEDDEGNVRKATFSAASRPFDVADAMAFEAAAGRAAPINSTGFPTRLVSLPARLGCSRALTARRRASRSSSVIWTASTKDNFELILRYIGGKQIGVGGVP